MNIDYCFFIGERCNINGFLTNKKILSSHSPFAGYYLSFNVSIDCIKTNFKNFNNNVITFKLDNEKKIIFNTLTSLKENINEIQKIISNNKFRFFNAINYYTNNFYSVNLEYTNINNFKNHQDLYYFDKYLIFPGKNFSNKDIILTNQRRIERFQNILNEKKYNQTLLIFMCKLINSIEELNNTIENIKKIYDLKYLLLFIIPNSIEKNTTCIKYNNIYFLKINFPNLEYQLKHNPNDDNSKPKYIKKYNEIYNFIIKTFDLSKLKRNY